MIEDGRKLLKRKLLEEELLEWEFLEGELLEGELLDGELLEGGRGRVEKRSINDPIWLKIILDD